MTNVSTLESIRENKYQKNQMNPLSLHHISAVHPKLRRMPNCLC